MTINDNQFKKKITRLFIRIISLVFILALLGCACEERDIFTGIDFNPGGGDDDPPISRGGGGFSTSTFVNITNVNDDGDLNLGGPTSATTIDLDGTTYLFVSGRNRGGSSLQSGLSVFSVDGNGAVSSITNLADNTSLRLAGAVSVTTTRVGDTNYLFVAAWGENAVSVFSIANDGNLSLVDVFRDNTNLEKPLSLTTTQIDGRTYLFVTKTVRNDGVLVFSVDGNGSLTQVSEIDINDLNIFDLSLFGSTIPPLFEAASVTTTQVGGTNYLFVAATESNALTVFSIDGGGGLEPVQVAKDNESLELLEASSVTTALIDGTTYVFVAGKGDDGVSVFSLANNGELSPVDNVDDSEDPNYTLAGASSVTTALINGTTYLFVAGAGDSGVSIFSVDSQGELTYVDSVDESEDPNYTLAGASSVTTALIDGTTYLFVTGEIDRGFSVFRIDL